MDMTVYRIILVLDIILFIWLSVGDKLVERINIRKLNKFYDTNSKRLKLKRVDDLHYKIKGKHYKVKNTTIIKNVPRKFEGRVVETYELEGPFVKVRNTIIDIASIKGVYVGYNRAKIKKKVTSKYAVLMLLLMVSTQLMKGEVVEYTYIGSIVLFLGFIFCIINYKDSRIVLEAYPNTIIKTSEGDYIVGSVMFFDEVKRMLGYNGIEKKDISNVQY